MPHKLSSFFAGVCRKKVQFCFENRNKNALLAFLQADMITVNRTHDRI